MSPDFELATSIIETVNSQPNAIGVDGELSILAREAMVMHSLYHDHNINWARYSLQPYVEPNGVLRP